MNSNESAFQEVMLRLGVRPIEEKKEKRAAPRTPCRDERLRQQSDPGRDDEALFLEAMADLESVPDKDSNSTVAKQQGFRKLKSLKNKKLELEESLDLHGKNTDDAIALLRAFVTRAFTSNVDTVIIITGKGKHSPGQRGVLRAQVEQWILREGKRFIRAYADAPRAHGGGGAFILYLRHS